MDKGDEMKNNRIYCTNCDKHVAYTLEGGLCKVCYPWDAVRAKIIEEGLRLGSHKTKTYTQRRAS